MTQTNPILSFERASSSYDRYSIVQQQVAEILIKGVQGEPKKILDLGCGSGNLFSRISWTLERFVGVDSAPGMLECHPLSPIVELVEADFDSWEIREEFELIISASALQWSKNLRALLRRIAPQTKSVALAIFTGESLQSLHHFLGSCSPLPCRRLLELELVQLFALTMELQRFTVRFKNARDLVHYLRHSGIGGGVAQASFAKRRALLEEFLVCELEFEVLFAWGRPK